MELDFSEQIKKLFVGNAEKNCPECDKPMSQCECDESKSKKLDKEELKEKEESKAGKMCAQHGIENCAKCTSKAEDVEKEVEDDEEDDDEEEEKEEMDVKTKAKNKIKAFIESKISKFNETNDRQITFAQVAEVFNRGGKAFESNHRIGVSKTQWSFARVNSFLKMVANQKVNASYAKADSDILSNNFDYLNTEFSDFSDLEFQLAKISVVEAGLTDTELAEDISFSAEKKKNKTLNKPFRLPSGSKKKFGVYVKNDKGNVVMVKFGDPNMSIKRDDPERRKSYRARHGCDSPGPKWKANYWSCKMWSKTPVSKLTSSENCGCGCGECEEKDIQDLVEIEGAKKGLWDNIREKKQRMGKNYKPAKPGSKDYPDKEAYKKAQAEEYDWDGEQEFNQEELILLDPSLANVEIVED
jgi:hypothetical protein